MDLVQASLHTHRPAVYLDQWVWIKLTSAALGRPRHPSHVGVLDAVQEAAQDGVAFPLSVTHYFETARINNPRQRHDIAALMGPISAMRTIRGGRELVRYQMLAALHGFVGRPAFRPTKPEVLGLGVEWAFRGVQSHLKVVDNDREVVSQVSNTWLRHLNQYAETEFLAGPWDEEIPALLQDGYVPARELEEQPQNRVDWEKLFAARLTDLTRSPSRAELSTQLLARELLHEHFELFDTVLAEHRLSVADIAGGGDTKQTRRRMVDFAQRIPRLRIAAEMKLELFRNTNRSWTWNMVRDIDFLSKAVPYCRVVVADRDATDLLKRAGADTRHGTVVTGSLQDLPDQLEDLRREARALPGDPTGWDALGPGTGFRTEMPPALSANVHRDASPDWTIQMTASDGSPARDD